MTTVSARKLFAATALVSVMAVSSAIAQGDENGGKKAIGERGAISQSMTFCDGGAQERVSTNTQNAAAITTSAGFVVIPSTTVPGGSSGVSGDEDTYTVTFSGEASATVGGNWEIQAQMSVNGGAYVNMDPIGPNTFHSGNAAHTHTMTWCKRVAATSSTSFRVVWRKNGGGSAVVDDYVMRVERSN